MRQWWREMVCRLRGHQPAVFNLTCTIPGMWMLAPCNRCGQAVEVEAIVAEPPAPRLRLVK